MTLASLPNEPLHLTLEVPFGMGTEPVNMISELNRQDEVPKYLEEKAQTQFTGHVLVADNDLIDQKVVSAILVKLGLEVTAVSNGQDALEQANRNNYDLFLIDMMMPDLDGCEVTRRLHQKGLAVPIVALTGNVMQVDIRACLAAGYDEHLPKPVDRQQLLDVLGHYLTPKEMAYV